MYSIQCIVYSAHPPQCMYIVIILTCVTVFYFQYVVKKYPQLKVNPLEIEMLRFSLLSRG